MFNLSLAGNLGRDAEYKTTPGGGELCSFSVAVDTGFGDHKVTNWVDVTRWGKGAEALARILHKGSKVAVCGELGTRESNGKTYLQVRADKVTILSTPKGDNAGNGGSHTEHYGADDDAESIPF